MQHSNQINMTKGPIVGALIRFSIPLILSGLLQQLYSWADALIVGNFIGEVSLAAIGATSTLSFLYIALIQGFAVGISILVSQVFGRGDEDAIPRVMSTFFVSLIGSSIFLTAISLLLMRPLLSLMGTPDDILSLSVRYLSIIYLGLPCLAVYNLYNAVLRGMGDSRTPLIAIVISSVGNVLLDLLFVAVFGWGVGGAAAATVLAQALMALFLLLRVPRTHPACRFRLGRGSIDRPILREGMRLGLPSALRFSVNSLGGLLLQNVMNSFGTVVIAAISTAYRIDSLGLLPTSNIGAGISIFSGQNKGADNPARAREGLRVGIFLSVGTSLVTTVFFVLCGAWLMRLFGVSASAVAIGREFLYTCAVFYPVFGLMQAFTGYLQGHGDVRFVTFVSLFTLALRVLLSYLLMNTLGHRVIAIAEMICWVLGAMLVAGRYWFVFRKDPGSSAASQ